MAWAENERAAFFRESRAGLRPEGVCQTACRDLGGATGGPRTRVAREVRKWATAGAHDTLSPKCARLVALGSAGFRVSSTTPWLCGSVTQFPHLSQAPGAASVLVLVLVLVLGGCSRCSRRSRGSGRRPRAAACGSSQHTVSSSTRNDGAASTN